MLECTLTTTYRGVALCLSVDTNTGYEGVTFMEWNKPWAYKAECDGVALGSHTTAVAAAIAVTQYRWVQANPCL